jgi:hypothetical protein
MIGRYVVIALALFMPGVAWAQAEGTWLVDARSKCKFWWPPEPYDAESFTYSAPRWGGACRNGLASGHGTFEFAVVWRLPDQSQRSYTQSGEVDFVDGKFSGKGFTSRRGPSSVSRYEGEFRDGLLNGKGIEIGETATSLGRYEGGFLNGKKNGWGIDNHESWQGKTRDRADYFRFEGEWRDGQLNGPGVYVRGTKGCSAEMRYEGEFVNGRWNGRGTLKALGKTYTGVWSDGQLGNVSTFEVVRDVDKACP